MPLTPAADRVAIVRDEPPSVSPGGIALVQSSMNKPARGRVESVGGDVHSIAPGSAVYFPEYAGHTIEHDGQEFLILKADEVLAVVT